jgi:hypothetical protein
MSRREIVLLVSRAIAILQFIEVLVYSLTSIVPLLLGLSLVSQRQQQISPALHALFETAHQTQVLLILVRIAVQLIVALLFWWCGPLVERLLLPAGSAEEA